jgi:hypothetical protein
LSHTSSKDLRGTEYYFGLGDKEKLNDEIEEEVVSKELDSPQDKQILEQWASNPN